MAHASGSRCHLYKHGGSGTRLYNIWKHIRQRIMNPNDKRYEQYGARGIKLCHEWETDFRNFRDWAYSAGYSEDLTIERIDVNKGYSPDNCKWIPLRDQPKNRTICNLLTAHGITDTIAGWSRRTGIHPETIRSRVNKFHWDHERAVTEGAKK